MTLGRTRSPRRSNRGDRQRDADREQDGMTESVVDIRRVAKTVAGGRRFTFDALVVVGDGQGRVGFGLGKAKEVPDAVQKGSAIARRALSSVALLEDTVPQQVVSKYGGARVMLKPAAPGTGVRASAAVRAVVQAAGVRDILTKSLGSSNPVNVVRATIQGLHMMRDPQEVIALRRMVRGEPPPAPEETTTSPTAETTTAEEAAAAPTAETATPEEATTAPTAETETPEEATTAPTAETTTAEEATTAPTAETEMLEETASAEEPPAVAQEEASPVAEATGEEPVSSAEEDQTEDSAPAEESPETAEAETPDEESEAVDEARADSDDDSEEKDS